MSDPDTTPEAVERLAAERDEKAIESRHVAAALRRAGRHPGSFLLAAEHAEATAATLRALLAERDGLQRHLDAIETAIGVPSVSSRPTIEHVKDLLAERDRLTKALRDTVTGLEYRGG